MAQSKPREASTQARGQAPATRPAITEREPTGKAGTERLTLPKVPAKIGQIVVYCRDSRSAPLNRAAMIVHVFSPEMVNLFVPADGLQEPGGVVTSVQYGTGLGQWRRLD